MTTNIIIPMAGAGSRFQSSGYNLPKPLIDVNGEPMIVKAIKTLNISGSYHFVIRRGIHSSEIKRLILEVIPNSNFIEIDYITDGPACTAMLFCDSINNDDELVIANCDQIMWWNADSFLRSVRSEGTDGTIVTYYSVTPKNSYAKINRAGRVVEIREKEVISTVSLNGIHYWRKGKYFVDSVREMIRCNDRAPNGEFYVGPSYNYMIKAGLQVGIYHIPGEQHHAVGTPDDLDRYIRLENEEIKHKR